MVDDVRGSYIRDSSRLMPCTVVRVVFVEWTDTVRARGVLVSIFYLFASGAVSFVVVRGLSAMFCVRPKGWSPILRRSPTDPAGPGREGDGLLPPN